MQHYVLSELSENKHQKKHNCFSTYYILHLTQQQVIQT